MKKEYEAPKAERMEYNYATTVVASGSVKCDWHYWLSQGFEGCTSHEDKQWVAD